MAHTEHAVNHAKPLSTGFEPSAQERAAFLAAFKAYMLSIAGPTFEDGSSVAEYADEVAGSYHDDPDQRADGPEECASADVSYWGD